MHSFVKTSIREIWLKIDFFDITKNYYSYFVLMFENNFSLFLNIATK